jgi:hypothetical protein
MVLAGMLMPPKVWGDPNALTDDKSVSVPTAYWTYTNVSTSTISSYLAANGARLTDIEVYNAATGRFTVTMVRNTGAYGVPGWWWYTGLSFASIGQLLATNNARLIDIEAYNNGASWAVIMVSNTGGAARAWSYLGGVTSGDIQDHLSDTGHRLIDLEAYFVNGVKRYAIIGVANTGADAKAWEWWLNQTTTSVRDRVNAFGGRITNLERQPDGTYNFIQVRNAGTDNKYWRFYFGLASLSSVVNVAGQFGTRVFDVETYVTSGVRRYDAVMIDNVDTETRRLTNLMAPTFTAPNGLPRANYGFYLKRVGGSVSVGLMQSRTFEPASAIKAVLNFAVMRRVQASTDFLSWPFTYYDYTVPAGKLEKDACPHPWEETFANALTSTLDFGKDNMMSISDNRTTRGIVLRYGLADINDAASDAGMSSTSIGQPLMGCGWENGDRNDTTLVDLGRLYEGVHNGTLLTGSARTEFFQPMNSGISLPIQNIVSQEAAAQSKSWAASQFISKMTARFKGGSYNICLDSDCAPYAYIRTVAGRMILPIKLSNGADSTRIYVYGRYVDAYNVCNGINPCSETTANAAINAVDPELFRAAIRSALLTW